MATACSKGGGVEIDGGNAIVLGLEEGDGSGALQSWGQGGGVF
jgi:hypothetical protein